MKAKSIYYGEHNPGGNLMSSHISLRYSSVPKTETSHYGLCSLKCRKRVERCSLLFSKLLFLKQSNTSQNSLTCYSSLGLPICHCLSLEEGQPHAQQISLLIRAQYKGRKHLLPLCQPSYIRNPQPSSPEPNRKPLRLCSLSTHTLPPWTLQGIV